MGTPTEGWPISQKGTIQNFEERAPAEGQPSFQEQYKILGRKDAGRRSANKPEGNNTKFLGRRTLAEGQPTSQKGSIQNFGEGGCRPKAGQQARREQYKIIGRDDTSRGTANKPEGNNTKFWGRRTLAEGQPTSQKGTIQNFGEGGCRPKAGQQARREQYKIIGRDDTGRGTANKPEGNNTKFWGRRTLAKGLPTSQKGSIQNFGEGGCQLKASQPARREQYKFLGSRTLAEGWQTS